MLDQIAAVLPHNREELLEVSFESVHLQEEEQPEGNAA